MNNKKYNFIIILLSLVIVCLIVFIVWDKVLMKEDSNVITDKGNDDNQGDNSNVITSIHQYPVKSGDDVILEGDVFDSLLSEEQKKLVSRDKDFENVKIDVNGVSLLYNCNEYTNEPVSMCKSATVKFPTMSLNFSWSLGCGVSHYVVYTKDYLLHQVMEDCVGIGYIEVYDKSGSLKLKIDKVVNKYTGENNDAKYSDIKYLDGKLYYISCVDKKQFSFNSVDLMNATKLETHSIEIFNDEAAFVCDNPY